MEFCPNGLLKRLPGYLHLWLSCISCMYVFQPEKKEILFGSRSSLVELKAAGCYVEWIVLFNLNIFLGCNSYFVLYFLLSNIHFIKSFSSSCHLANIDLNDDTDVINWAQFTSSLLRHPHALLESPHDASLPLQNHFSALLEARCKSSPCLWSCSCWGC